MRLRRSLICERLLPKIQEFTGVKKVTMYSVLYTLANTDQTATYPIVHDEIQRSYDAIVGHLQNTRKGRVVALVGDSAGGNLCYCLAMQLLHRMGTEAHIPAAHFALGKLCQRRVLQATRGSTPFFTYKDDILSLKYIQRSRVNYFGPSGYPPTNASVEIGTESKTTLPVSCINPWLSISADNPLVKALPSVYCVAGTRDRSRTLSKRSRSSGPRVSHYKRIV